MLDYLTRVQPFLQALRHPASLVRTTNGQVPPDVPPKLCKLRVLLGWHRGIATLSRVWVRHRAERNWRGAGCKERCGPAPGRGRSGRKAGFQRAEPEALEQCTPFSRSPGGQLASSPTPQPGRGVGWGGWRSWGGSALSLTWRQRAACRQRLGSTKPDANNLAKQGRRGISTTEKRGRYRFTGDAARARRPDKRFPYIISRNPLRAHEMGPAVNV